MKAVILCGGQGSRIRDVNEALPKPLLPIGAKPILWHIMKGYEVHGVTEFVLCLGYKGWLIKEFFLNYRAMTADLTVRLGQRGAVEFIASQGNENWDVTLAETGGDTMTAARIAAVRRYVECDGSFCLTYGDGVANVNIRESIAFHEEHGKIATVTAMRPPGRFGEIQTDGHLVTHFNEKPQMSRGFINGGFFVLDGRRIWDYLGTDPSTSFEREPLQRLAADRQLVAYEHGDFFQPMDTARDFRLLNDLWDGGNAPWRTW